MTRLLLGIAAATAAMILVHPTPATAEDEPTCQGQVATIVGTSYADTLYGTPGPDVVWLGGAEDETDEYDSDDRFWGLAGDDLVCQGGRGGASIFGGDGDDEIHLDGPIHDLHGVSALGEAGDDLLVGAPAAWHGSYLVGGDGADVLVGGEGGDGFTPGDGDDDVRGGAGDDVVDEGPGSDTIDGGTGRDQVSYGASYNGWVGGDGVSAPIVLDVAAGSVISGPDLDTVEAVECFVGTSKADVMTGTEGPDCLHGGVGEGADRVRGLGGDDEITIFSGTADSGAGDDTVSTEYLYIEHDDETPLEPIRTQMTVTAGPGDDHVYARGFQVLVSGGTGVDVLDLTGSMLGDGYRTGDVAFRIDVRRHQITAAPDQSFQSTTTFSATERFEGSYFPDVFSGGPGDDHFFGGHGDDRARSSGGDDVLLGGPDADRLQAGGGRDLVRGQSGRPDVADGGPGRDRCSAERQDECEAPA